MFDASEHRINMDHDDVWHLSKYPVLCGGLSGKECGSGQKQIMRARAERVVTFNLQLNKHINQDRLVTLTKQSS